ncbi:hypothetical protein [Maledivibacter halophilus]|uniref:Uncharacterized protein n=1 Tax=Maledivibacter halophilus TaxID=36842 RepID=A0A1T5KYS5_9FIRM|nr:hypothetical protein [Maledivibacter halophilus]SKC68982.1 hypothetical protein SAMN02194393_02195 [Maledivibacter halophilus]
MKSKRKIILEKMKTCICFMIVIKVWKVPGTTRISNLTKIAKGIGFNRIFRGNSVLHVFGNPLLPELNEIAYRKGLVSKVLNMLNEKPPKGQSSLIWE